MRRWLRHHHQALGRALGKLGRAPFATLLTELVIGVTLALPAAGYLLVSYVDGLAGRINAEPQVSVFLALDAGPADLKAVEAKLKADARVASFKFVPREAALAEMRSVEGLKDVIDGLDANPLPHAYIVRARESTPDALEALATMLQTLPKAEHVQLDSAWARRLASFNALARKLVLGLAAVLGVALVAVIGNTIRLQILTQRDEIEVGRLIGATDGFIRRPYLYYGAIQGALAGILAIALAVGGMAWLGENAGELLQAYAPGYAPTLPPLAAAGAVVGAAALLGWLGAWLSVSFYLGDVAAE